MIYAEKGCGLTMEKTRACILLNEQSKLCLALMQDQQCGDVEMWIANINDAINGEGWSQDILKFDDGSALKFYNNVINNAVLDSGYRVVCRSLSADREKVFDTARMACKYYRNGKAPWFDNGCPKDG